MSEGSITSVVPEERWGELNHDDLTRYSRQLLLSEIGIEGQRKLKGAKVLVVGTGGLGAPLALYLAAAGVGTLGLVDFDNVDISNLHRQIIHGTRDVDRPKVASARDRIRALNPLVNVVTYNEPLKSENALDIISEYDVVADGTDNYPTRYLVNDACVLLGKPNVYGSVFQFEGQASVFYAKQGPCYRCLYREPPPPGLVPSCAEGGVLGVLPGVIGMLQANEVIKLLVGGGDTLTGRLLLYDAWRMKFRELKLEKDPECPICGKHPTITKLIDYEQFCGIRHNQDETSVESISATELKRRFDANEPVQVVDLREPHERAYFKFPNAKTIPLGQVIRRKDELDPSIDTVFVCKIGQRSILAVRNLRAAGYQGKLMNLLDGVQGWKNEVDPNVKLI
ncbi:MAG: molybdopterin-synthase adenylyltransferase MoeB [Victivallales bacterium]|nr:molybdopterin-synthase adenylyltransferase MoeB [Victivallales bacterium]